ncbi:MAG: nitroreductase family protein [Bacilli bacterium]|nr:nitroreductase family protein [Bacilli bacterium]
MGNAAYDVIMNRHSCRKFLDKEVPDELLDKVLAAGLAAPTGRNSQQTYFLAIKDPGVIEELRKLNASIMGTMSIDPFYGAKAVIVVLHAKEDALGTYDGSIAMAQMMIAAESLGLASTWIHRAKEVFALPEGKAILNKAGFPRAEFVGVGNLILGYPDEGGKKEHGINPGRAFKL